jgi:ABC-type Na+ efflux pump permease subunit
MNDTILKTEILDAVVRDTIRAGLDSSMIAEAVDEALTLLQADGAHQRQRRADITRELAGVEQRLARLMEALIKGGTLDTIVAQIKVDEERKRALQADLKALDDAAQASEFDADEVRRQLAEAARDVTTLVAGTTAQARQMLLKILAAKINAEPSEQDGRRGFRLSGELVIGRLLPTDVFGAVEAVTSGMGSSRWGQHQTYRN